MTMPKMKNICLYSLLALIIIAFSTSPSIAGASKKSAEEGQKVEQEAGQPLYFDPDTAKGVHVDDSAPYSDPAYGKEHLLKGTHGKHRGPEGVTEESKEVKIIEGPTTYEEVD